MEGRDNWRIWNWPGCVEIKPTTIHLRLNGSLGRYICFVFGASSRVQFLSNKLPLYSQKQDQLDLRNPDST